jgi:hypothetical protein
VDDLPPSTVITSIKRTGDGRLLVSGATSDNGTVKYVRINGREAKSVEPNFARWEITLSPVHELIASAEDVAGNVEKTPHKLYPNFWK